MPEITVKLSSAPHQDVPDNSKLVAQIIVDQIVLVQTIPVSSVDDNGDCWELAVDCKMCVSIYEISSIKPLVVLQVHRASLLPYYANGLRV